MLKISTKSQYGLRAMVYLASFKNKISSVKEISEKEGISFNYLEKIMSKLEKAKLVRAQKGVQGGYFLVKPLKKITVGEILKTLEGKTYLVKCLSGKDFYCPRKRICKTVNVWRKIQEVLNKTLDSITLADLVENKK